jgi:glutathione synthase/RimK-type ligase-like ATP-grasp enzyme
MILIITHKEDYTADFLIEKLNKKRIGYYRLNCEDIFITPYSINPFLENPLNIDGFSKFDSVWFRRFKLPPFDEVNPHERLYLIKDFETLFSNIFEVLSPKVWISKPDKIYRAENKLLQLTEARNTGFHIPETLVTNNHLELLNFYNYQDKKLIIKPIRQGRVEMTDGFKNIFTNFIQPEIIENIYDFDLTPCIFQRHIQKQYELRITVVKNKLFTVKIDSQANQNTSIDWRKEKVPLIPFTLPTEIGLKCIELVDKLGLSFGAIDMIYDREGRYIFLEINPNGQWAWIELETGLPISDAIISILSGDEND